MHFLGFNQKNHFRQIFDQCLKDYGHKHKWLGFIDADEFIWIKDESIQLPAFLDEFKQYGGVVFNWMQYGSSNHIKRPEGGLLKNYRNCVPNGTLKTFVQPKHSIGTGGNSHYFKYYPSFHAVNVIRQRVDTHWHVPDDRVIAKATLNHYKIKSAEDFKRKLDRWGSDWGGTIRAGYSPELFDRLNRDMDRNCSIPAIADTLMTMED